MKLGVSRTVHIRECLLKSFDCIVIFQKQKGHPQIMLLVSLKLDAVEQLK